MLRKLYPPHNCNRFMRQDFRDRFATCISKGGRWARAARRRQFGEAGCEWPGELCPFESTIPPHQPDRPLPTLANECGIETASTPWSEKTLMSVRTNLIWLGNWSIIAYVKVIKIVMVIYCRIFHKLISVMQERDAFQPARIPSMSSPDDRRSDKLASVISLLRSIVQNYNRLRFFKGEYFAKSWMLSVIRCWNKIYFIIII